MSFSSSCLSIAVFRIAHFVRPAQPVTSSANGISNNQSRAKVGRGSVT